MNKHIATIAILAALGLTLPFTGCKRQEVPSGDAKTEPSDEHHDEVKLSAEAIKRYGIQVAEVRREVLVPKFVAPARVTLNTDAMAHVGSPRSGRAVDVRVKKGDIVNKGDTLLVVESPEFGEAQSEYLQRLMAVEIARSGVEIARPAVETAQRTLDIAQSSYDRGKKLMEESQGITITEVQKREVDLRTAQGALKAAEADVKRAEAAVLAAVAESKSSENRLHLLGMNQAAVEALAKSAEIEPRFTIVAPMDGQVLERGVTLGELVSPEKESLLVLGDLSTLWVIADVPEVQLKDIAVGSEAQIRLVATGQQSLTGRVSFVDTILDPSTRSARVRIEVSNKDGFIRPGMFAQVEIESGQAKDKSAVLAIPEDAVQTVEGSPAVFVPVKGEENTFTKRPVSVGKAVGGLVPVNSGLEDGEPMVVKGSFIMKAELGKGSGEEE